MRAVDTLTGSMILDEVVAVIGWESTMALARAFGGTRLHVPRSCTGDHRIAAAIGEKAAARFCDAFHGTLISIPIRLRRMMRVRELAAHTPRLTKAQIAEQVGITERAVIHILAQPEPPHDGLAVRDTRQPGLFDHLSR